MKIKVDYSKYECPYSHLEKESGHELHGPKGYKDFYYSVWCACGFRAPVFYLEPDELGLKLKEDIEVGKAVSQLADIADEQNKGETMKTIHKFKLNIAKDTMLSMPKESHILDIKMQGDELVMWALVNTSTELIEVKIACAGTGWELYSYYNYTYIKTIQIGIYVWHYFMEEEV